MAAGMDSLSCATNIICHILIFMEKQNRRKQEGTMAKNDYTQKQTNKNNSENTQKNQSKNSTKESTSDCKDKNNQ